MEAGADREQRADWRPALIGAAAVLLAGIVAIVVLAGGDESPAAAAPPPGCIEEWNGDRAAQAYGAHNFAGHGYSQAHVLLLDPTAEAAASAEEGGRCAVVFPAGSLDPEPIAAAQTFVNGRWVPLSSAGVEEARLAELQADAVSAVNARLLADGTLTEL